MKKNDLKLLYELELDSRRPVSSIGKITRMSQQTADYKIKQFLDKGIIRNFMSVINYGYCNYLCFRVFFQIRQNKKEEYQKMVKELMEHKHVLDVIMVRSRYDLLVTFAYPDPLSFNKDFKKFVDEYHPVVKDYDITTSVLVNYFGKKYLRESAKGSGVMIGGHDEKFELTPLDKGIIYYIANNPRIKITDLSTKLDKAPQTILQRLKLLKKSNVILQYSCFIDHLKIDYSGYIILLRAKNLTRRQEDILSQFCSEDPNIISFTKTFGLWDYEIVIEADSGPLFRKIYEMLREQIEDYVIDFNILIVNEIKKISYLPEAFSEEI